MTRHLDSFENSRRHTGVVFAVSDSTGSPPRVTIYVRDRQILADSGLWNFADQDAGALITIDWFEWLMRVGSSLHCIVIVGWLS